MADMKSGDSGKALQIPSTVTNSGSAGVCMMNRKWRDEQHPAFIDFISSFLRRSSYNLILAPVSPDMIFNCGGASVAFVFVTNWDCADVAPIFRRVKQLKGQFAHLYVVVTLSTSEQNDSFVRSYFRFSMEPGKPTFIPVHDPEMGFKKIVKMAYFRGAPVCKRQDATSKVKAERKCSIEDMDIFLKVVTAIPGINKHDANTLNHAIGSIEAIAKASKEEILEKTDLSSEKAEMVTRFFRDEGFYLRPKVSSDGA